MQIQDLQASFGIKERTKQRGCSQSCTYPLFLPHGVEMERIVFLLYGQPFPRYRSNFKLAVFGHETWPLSKVPEIAHTLSFYPRRSKLNLFSLHSTVVKIEQTSFT